MIFSRSLRDDLRLWRMTFSDGEIVWDEFRAICLTVTKAAVFSGYASMAVHLAATTALAVLGHPASEDFPTIDGLLSHWWPLFVLGLFVSPSYHVPPIVQRYRRLQEYDKLSTRELLELEARIKRDLHK